MRKLVFRRPILIAESYCFNSDGNFLIQLFSGSWERGFLGSLGMRHGRSISHYFVRPGELKKKSILFNKFRSI